MKRVGGSYVECQHEELACVRVWGMLVQWNMVKLANVGGVVCVLVFMVDSERDILEHIHAKVEKG
uniref:hypothetical protein n=1 Tax=Candidatus Fervidibacter sp. TaxID=3100871 RepID=UPI00404B909D